MTLNGLLVDVKLSKQTVTEKFALYRIVGAQQY